MRGVCRSRKKKGGEDEEGGEAKSAGKGGVEDEGRGGNNCGGFLGSCRVCGRREEREREGQGWHARAQTPRKSPDERPGGGRQDRDKTGPRPFQAEAPQHAGGPRV